MTQTPPSTARPPSVYRDKWVAKLQAAEQGTPALQLPVQASAADDARLQFNKLVPEGTRLKKRELRAVRSCACLHAGCRC